jgi:hypothetical protein
MYPSGVWIPPHYAGLPETTDVDFIGVTGYLDYLGLVIGS